MDWKIGFYPRARKDIENLDKLNRRRVSEKVDWLARDFEDTRHEPLQIPLDGHYKLRVGKIRVVYFPNYKSGTIEVEYLNYRDKVYK